MYELNIIRDEDGVNPQTEQETLGISVFFHKRYQLGQFHDFQNPFEFFKSLVREHFTAEEFLDQVYRLQGIEIKEDEDEGRCTVTYQGNSEELNCSENFEEDLLEGLIDFLPYKELEEICRQKMVLLPVYLMDHSGLSISTTPFGCPWDSGKLGHYYCSFATIEKQYGETPTDVIIAYAEEFMRGEIRDYNHYLQGDVYRFSLLKDGEEIDSCGGFVGDYETVLEQMKDMLPEDAWYLVDEKKTA